MQSKIQFELWFRFLYVDNENVMVTKLTNIKKLQSKLEARIVIIINVEKAIQSAFTSGRQY